MLPRLLVGPSLAASRTIIISEILRHALLPAECLVTCFPNSLTCASDCNLKHQQGPTHGTRQRQLQCRPSTKQKFESTQWPGLSSSGLAHLIIAGFGNATHRLMQTSHAQAKKCRTTSPQQTAANIRHRPSSSKQHSLLSLQAWNKTFMPYVHPPQMRGALVTLA